jgi:hypothetical protein
MLEQPLVDRLSDDRERLDVRPDDCQWTVVVLDVAKLVPRGPGEAPRGEDLQGWRRGLEPPTTGTTTRGSTN